MKRVLATGCFFTLFVSISSAWGPIGHMLVAAVAWKQMKPSTRREIARILRFGDEVSGNYGGQFDHIDYVKIDPESASDDDIERLVGPAFIQAATWPDDIKSPVIHVPHQTVPAPDFATLITTLNGKMTSTDPAEASDLKAWHFVDYPLVYKSSHVVIDLSSKHPIDPPGLAKPAAHALNALSLEIEPNIKKVAPNATSDPNDTAIYLYLLEHIVGDLHQPLHCATLYSSKFSTPTTSGANTSKSKKSGSNKKDPNASDHGGNLFKLSTSKKGLNGMAFKPQANLHSLWDHGGDNAILADPSLGITDPSKMTSDDFFKVAEAWIQSSAPSQQAANEPDPKSWAQDSEQLAVDSAYKGLKMKSSISEAYAKHNVDVCRHQIVLGGYRLAKLLDSELN